MIYDVTFTRGCLWLNSADRDSKMSFMLYVRYFKRLEPNKTWVLSLALDPTPTAELDFDFALC